MDLLLKTTRQHFVGLVQDKHTDRIRTQSPSLDHIVDTAGGADDDMHTLLEVSDIILNVRTTNASMTLRAHIIAKSDYDLLNLLSQLTCWRKDQSLALWVIDFDLLKDRDRECGSFPST